MIILRSRPSYVDHHNIFPFFVSWPPYMLRMLRTQTLNPTSPINLVRLGTKVMELLSPCGSQFTTTTHRYRYSRCTVPNDTQLRWEFYEDSDRLYVMYLKD